MTKTKLALALLLAVTAALAAWYPSGFKTQEPRVPSSPETTAPVSPVEATADDAAEAREEPTDSRRVDVTPGGGVLVVDHKGEPIQGASVRTRGDPPVEAATDPSGRCLLPMDTPYWFEVRAAGFAGQFGHHPGKEEVRVELAPAIVLTGQVLDADTRQPVPGASVRFAGLPRSLGSGQVACDALGRFQMMDVPAVEKVLIYAGADSYPERHSNWDLRGLSDEAEVEILITHAVALEVRLLDAENGAPLVGLTVNRKTTDGEGRVLLELMPETDDRTLGFRVEGEDFYSLRCSFVSDAPSPMEIRLPLPGQFEGFLRDEAGSPVANAEVDFKPADGQRSVRLPLPHGTGTSHMQFGLSCESDSVGYYSSPPLLPQAEYQVVVRHRRYPELTKNLGAATAGMASRRDLIVKGSAPIPVGSIEGRVIMNGKPAEASVLWRSQDAVGRAPTGGRPRWTREEPEGSLAKGRYRADDVPVGEVDLHLQFDDSHLNQAGRYLDGSRVTVEVSDGRATVHDFALELPTVPIGGRVTTRGGEAPDKLRVRATENQGRFFQQTSTETEGRWRIEVPSFDWEYVVYLEHGGTTLRVEGVRPGDLDVNITLPPPTTAELPVRVLDAETGGVVQEWELTYLCSGEETHRRGRALSPGGESMRPGGLFHIDVPPGKLDLFISSRALGYQTRRVRDVLVHERKDTPVLEVRLERGLELEITLEDGVDDPSNHRAWMLLLEADLWETVHHGREKLPGEPGVRYGSDDLVFGYGPFYSSGSLNTRFVRFDDRRAVLRGLSPGSWRFKGVPSDIIIQPEFVTLPHDGPLPIRWHREP